MKNEKFFRKWTPEMAYVLGFFTADGSMMKNKRGAHFIEFQIVDRDLLEKIRRLLGSNHKITKRIRNNDWKPSYRLQIGSKVIFHNLLELGLVPNKSKRIRLPNIPGEYFHHFVRGYFDGDGHVCISQYARKNRNNKKMRIIVSGFTSSTKEFLNNLHTRLKQYAFIIGGTLFYSKGYRLSFSINDSPALYKFLYRDNETELCLKRKKEVFEKHFNMGP